MRHPSRSSFAASIAMSLTFLAGGCGDPAAPSPLQSADPAEARHFAVTKMSAWSAAMPLAELNTVGFTEGCPFITRSGEALYFASNRPGTLGGLDLYVAYWNDASQTWGPATNLGPSINTAANEQCPMLLNDAHDLVFVSDRQGGLGGLDLWMARRADKSRTDQWGAAVNLTALNSGLADFGPNGYEDDHGNLVLYFNSNRTGGSGAHDLYMSTRVSGTFSAPVPVPSLNTTFEEQFPALSKHGLEIVFASNRPGTLGGLDLWRATRTSTSAAWSAPENLGPAVNSPAAEARSTLSWDGTLLIFHSTRAGDANLYRSTRHRMNGPAR